MLANQMGEKARRSASLLQSDSWISTNEQHHRSVVSVQQKRNKESKTNKQDTPIFFLGIPSSPNTPIPVSNNTTSKTTMKFALSAFVSAMAISSSAAFAPIQPSKTTLSSSSSSKTSLNYSVGIVGATGAVGKEIRQCLETRGKLQVDQLRIFGSERSAGKTVETKYGDIQVELFRKNRHGNAMSSSWPSMETSPWPMPRISVKERMELL